MKMSKIQEIIKEELELMEFSYKAHGKRVKEWEFPSSSSSKTYTTVKWKDGVYSCNCPGWTRRIDKEGFRNCKHIKAVGGKPYKV